MPEWSQLSTFLVAVAVAALVALVLVAAIALPFRLIARRTGWRPAALARVRRPFRVLIVVVALWIAIASSFPSAWADWEGSVVHVLQIAAIAAGAWLVTGIMGFLFSRASARYPMDVADNRVARRVNTQIAILRRVGTVAIAILAIGAILLTFPGARAVGASLLASAGLASVVAGLAAQSTLTNVFAGIQLAFSDAIRVDDVVIAEGEWGRIEEITLTYVVVHIWDDRRMVLPSTYFTTTPFENWTRQGSELLGSVELDLDWWVSPSAMRKELERVLEQQPLWDGRASVLQVTDAVGGMVRVRILVTAANAPALFDLRCNVREAMVEWMQRSSPASVPRSRVELVEAQKPNPKRRASGEEQQGLFSGSREGEERQQDWT
jgi:small-conductance mechanosensitive channel